MVAAPFKVRNRSVFRALYLLLAQTEVCGYQNQIYRTASEGHRYEHGAGPCSKRILNHEEHPRTVALKGGESSLNNLKFFIDSL